ncbi:hypothetical protein [Puia sp.]|jgi:hypothetical protein|uniref:hypothetical protein n=1 Tax=Puia sp. TaxID=2045100 RepID=UPI002F3EF90D
MTPTLSWRRVGPVLAIYTLLTTLGLRAHELFLDEAHHFLLARDSTSWIDLYNNARFDGHPRLWHTLLFIITHTLTTNPVAMQVLQGLISVSVAFVFLRYAPFSLPVKIGVLFGYYLLFEYNLLSRNYALGILFLFIACALLNTAGSPTATTGRTSRPLLPLGFLILLMCNTHVFFTFAAIGLYGFLFLEYAGQKKLLTRPFLVFTGIFLLAFACALIQARVPQVDNVNLTPVKPDKFLSAGNFSFAAFGLVRGWLPIPATLGGRFWNHYWLSEERTGRIIGIALFLLLLTFPALFLHRARKALLFYYACAGLLLLFFDVTQMTAARYFGMVFIFFLVACWLAAKGRPDALADTPFFFRALLYGIIGLQLIIGWFAFEQDLTRPFSQSRNTVRYLQSLPPGEKIVVDGYNSGPMLCAYLQGKVFYLTTGAEGSFCVWKKSWFPYPRPSIAEELAQWPALRQLTRFILVANRPLTNTESPHFQLTPLRSFENSIQGENYYVYQVDTH